MQILFSLSSHAFCWPPTSFLPFKKFQWTLSVLLLLPPFSRTACLFLLLPEPAAEGTHSGSLAAISGPALFPGSIPCFSSSSGILCASTAALALPHSFNPSCSGSAAIKEVHFSGACYRSVSRRTRRSLCSAARAATISI